VHDPAAIEAATQFWATSLGVDEERLETEGVTVVPNAIKFPFRAITMLKRRNACVLSLLHTEPSALIEAVMRIGQSHAVEDLVRKEPWEDVSDSVTPAATVFVCSIDRIPPMPKRGVRMLSGSDDLLEVGRLMDRADPEEWGWGDVDPRAEIMAGIHDDGELVAVGCLERASRQLAIARVFVTPEMRRRGLASSLVSHLASQHSTVFRAVQLTVNKGDAAGEGLALSLGFFPFGETASVILKESFH